MNSLDIEDNILRCVLKCQTLKNLAENMNYLFSFFHSFDVETPYKYNISRVGNC